jgi:ParB-like chromosome segregation protein Spo0J
MNEIVIADPSTLTVHPAAALFPMLDERQLDELAGDIKSNGLLSPVVVRDREILDGRNRLRACELAGVPPRFVEWSGAGSITSWIFSVNLHRRHLTASQRAMLAARAVDVFEQEAIERQKRGVADADGGRSRHKAAEVLNVGATSVLRAQQVIANGAPELVAAVESGEVPVRAATELVALPREEQAALVRERKVIGRAKEVREQRRPPTPRPPPTPASPAPAPPPRTPRPAPPPSDRPALVSPSPSAPARSRLDEVVGDDDEGSTLDPSNRPDPQPIPLTAFRSDYRRGTNPKEEAPKVDQILAAARTSLHAWRWIVIEWNEDKRWDMKFAIHESGQIAMHLQQAVARLEELSEICNGRKPAPPSERP